eukprot:8842898-Lingulodinium_polyedra.AAC.1
MTGARSMVDVVLAPLAAFQDAVVAATSIPADKVTFANATKWLNDQSQESMDALAWELPLFNGSLESND